MKDYWYPTIIIDEIAFKVITISSGEDELNPGKWNVYHPFHLEEYVFCYIELIPNGFLIGILSQFTRSNKILQYDTYRISVCYMAQAQAY